MAALFFTLSIASLGVAQQAIQVLPVFTTTYSAGQVNTAGASDASCSAGQDCGGVYSSSATVTAAPIATASAASTYNVYSEMPYQSMSAGGYQQLQCGYGWSKGANGQCVKESWVSLCPIIIQPNS